MNLRAGLIGFGLAGRSIHAPLLMAANFCITAVVTSRRDAAGEALPGATVYDSARALVSRDDIDLVVVASPNGFHAEHASEALLGGKHVVVDKPLCLAAAEARELEALSRRERRMLAVFQNRRWDSDFLTVRKLIEDGRLGDINSFHARWDRYRPNVADRWRERDEPGAGVLYDLGSHLIDQALALFGLPEWIQADVFRQRDGALSDDGFELLMGQGALRITLGSSSLVSDGGWRYRVHGAQSSFLKAGLDVQESQLRAGGSLLDADFGVEPSSQCGTLVHGATGQREMIMSEHGRWTDFYLAVRRSIEEAAAPPVSALDACRTIEVIEAALRASATGRRIEF